MACFGLMQKLSCLNLSIVISWYSTFPPTVSYTLLGQHDPSVRYINYLKMSGLLLPSCIIESLPDSKYVYRVSREFVFKSFGKRGPKKWGLVPPHPPPNPSTTSIIQEEGSLGRRDGRLSAMFWLLVKWNHMASQWKMKQDRREAAKAWSFPLASTVCHSFPSNFLPS